MMAKGFAGEVGRLKSGRCCKLLRSSKVLTWGVSACHSFRHDFLGQSAFCGRYGSCFKQRYDLCEAR